MGNRLSLTDRTATPRSHGHTVTRRPSQATPTLQRLAAAEEQHSLLRTPRAVRARCSWCSLSFPQERRRTLSSSPWSLCAFRLFRLFWPFSSPFPAPFSSLFSPFPAPVSPLFSPFSHPFSPPFLPAFPLFVDPICLSTRHMGCMQVARQPSKMSSAYRSARWRSCRTRLYTAFQS